MLFYFLLFRRGNENTLIPINQISIMFFFLSPRRGKSSANGVNRAAAVCNAFLLKFYLR